MPPRPPVAATAEPLPEGQSGKIARVGIKREEGFMYYIKGGDVWAHPMKVAGGPKGESFVVATIGIEMDYERYLYYLDMDGDVARKARNR